MCVSLVLLLCGLGACMGFQQHPGFFMQGHPYFFRNHRMVPYRTNQMVASPNKMRFFRVSQNPRLIGNFETQPAYKKSMNAPRHHPIVHFANSQFQRPTQKVTQPQVKPINGIQYTVANYNNLKIPGYPDAASQNPDPGASNMASAKPQLEFTSGYSQFNRINEGLNPQSVNKSTKLPNYPVAEQNKPNPLQYSNQNFPNNIMYNYKTVSTKVQNNMGYEKMITMTPMIAFSTQNGEQYPTMPPVNISNVTFKQEIQGNTISNSQYYDSTQIASKQFINSFLFSMTKQNISRNEFTNKEPVEEKLYSTSDLNSSDRNLSNLQGGKRHNMNVPFWNVTEVAPKKTIGYAFYADNLKRPIPERNNYLNSGSSYVKTKNRNHPIAGQLSNLYLNPGYTSKSYDNLPNPFKEASQFRDVNDFTDRTSMGVHILANKISKESILANHLDKDSLELRQRIEEKSSGKSSLPEIKTSYQGFGMISHIDQATGQIFENPPQNILNNAQIGIYSKSQHSLAIDLKPTSSLQQAFINHPNNQHKLELMPVEKKNELIENIQIGNFSQNKFGESKTFENQAKVDINSNKNAHQFTNCKADQIRNQLNNQSGYNIDSKNSPFREKFSCQNQFEPVKAKQSIETKVFEVKQNELDSKWAQKFPDGKKIETNRYHTIKFYENLFFDPTEKLSFIQENAGNNSGKIKCNRKFVVEESNCEFSISTEQVNSVYYNIISTINEDKFLSFITRGYALPKIPHHNSNENEHQFSGSNFHFSILTPGSFQISMKDINENQKLSLKNSRKYIYPDMNYTKPKVEAANGGIPYMIRDPENVQTITEVGEIISSISMTAHYVTSTFVQMSTEAATTIMRSDIKIYDTKFSTKYSAMLQNIQSNVDLGGISKIGNDAISIFGKPNEIANSINPNNSSNVASVVNQIPEYGSYLNQGLSEMSKDSSLFFPGNLSFPYPISLIDQDIQPQDFGIPNNFQEYFDPNIKIGNYYEMREMPYQNNFADWNPYLENANLKEIERSTPFPDYINLMDDIRNTMGQFNLLLERSSKIRKSSENTSKIENHSIFDIKRNVKEIKSAMTNVFVALNLITGIIILGSITFLLIKYKCMQPHVVQSEIRTPKLYRISKTLSDVGLQQVANYLDSLIDINLAKHVRSLLPNTKDIENDAFPQYFGNTPYYDNLNTKQLATLKVKPVQNPPVEAQKPKANVYFEDAVPEHPSIYFQNNKPINYRNVFSLNAYPREQTVSYTMTSKACIQSDKVESKTVEFNAAKYYTMKKKSPEAESVPLENSGNALPNFPVYTFTNKSQFPSTGLLQIENAPSEKSDQTLEGTKEIAKFSMSVIMSSEEALRSKKTSTESAKSSTNSVTDSFSFESPFGEEFSKPEEKVSMFQSFVDLIQKSPV